MQNISFLFLNFISFSFCGVQSSQNGHDRLVFSRSLIYLIIFFVNILKDLSKIIGFTDFNDSKVLLKALIAELLGTFLLIFLGVASTVPDLSPGYEPSVVQIGFTFGLVVATLVQVSYFFF